MRPRKGLGSDECQEIRTDHVGMSGHHAVRQARVNRCLAIQCQFIRHAPFSPWKTPDGHQLVIAAGTALSGLKLR
jgi:hypothetical protein